MKRKLLLAFTLMMVASISLFTTSCGKQTMQNQTETIGQTETRVESETTRTEPQQTETATMAEVPESDIAEFVPKAIYFEYDSATLSQDVPHLLSVMVEYLQSNPNLALKVQGHCDERGSGAYNMALGKQRAESVKTYLVSLGIPAARLDAISYGESRPASTGHDEAAWAKNRRVEFETN